MKDFFISGDVNETQYSNQLYLLETGASSSAPPDLHSRLNPGH
jgi:hypothetical protein